ASADHQRQQRQRRHHLAHDALLQLARDRRGITIIPRPLARKSPAQPESPPELPPESPPELPPESPPPSEPPPEPEAEAWPSWLTWKTLSPMLIVAARVSFSGFGRAM